MPIRVFVYDDYTDRRAALKALLSLSENFIVAGEAADCSHALEDIEKTYPDVVLMDINMPGVDGLEGLKMIKENYPGVKVLMQTAFDDSEKIFTSIKCGASGYILKNDSPQKLLQAIYEVYEGGAAMNPAIAKKVLDFFKPQKIKNPLSPKESEVLSLLAEGLSYKMVADKLGISYNTVNGHVKNIYQKLHVACLGEAIAYYYKHLKP
ncbi:MAG: response regulator transcription factor [Parafilimonas sp.]|nr:response regulator transcription factor [Parafilimonas sp.]